MLFYMIFYFIVLVILILIVLISYLIYKQNKNILSNKKNKLIKDKINRGVKVNFLHIPKNAGISISKMYNLHDQYKGTVYHPYTLPKHDYINFAIVRHPETRLQSIFAHIKDRDSKKTSYDLNEFKNLDDLARAYYNKNDKNHKKAKKIFEWDIHKLKSYKNDGCTKTEVCIHWCPQSLFVYGHDADVDYLLKFENLNKDLKKLIDMGVLENKELLHKNKSHEKYKKLTELTPICKRLVKDIYGKDFKLWEKAGLN